MWAGGWVGGCVGVITTRTCTQVISPRCPLVTEATSFIASSECTLQCDRNNKTGARWLRKGRSQGRGGGSIEG